MLDPHTIFLMASAVFLIPLAGFAVMALGHNRLPRHGDLVATAAMGLCLALSIAIFILAARSPEPVLVNRAFDWLPAGAGTGLILRGGVLVDGLTAVMLVVVTLVSFLVHLFSTKYMAGDVRYGRYYCGLLLFTTSMLGLVLANNLLYLYIFWELVGLSSYLLIGHWYEKKSASDAAIKAFITTRLGDVGMALGIFICWWQVGSLQYADLFAAVERGTLAGDWRLWAGLGLFLGAMGKSAQFPLHVWLPDAMEGPTPVSALIHAATMVAAGVYLTGRMLPIFDPATLLFIAYVGGFTALFAATIALVQDDIKKVLAYSTVSQLGYMIMGLGVGGYVSGLFHLTTHAFFKACLFLGSGAVIHAMHHEQSMSRYGGLARKMPWTAATYLLATLALCGVWPLSGFYSKDAILGDALAFAMRHPAHYFLPIAGFTTALLTAFYMFRQYFLTFTGAPRDAHAFEHAHEVPWAMRAPLVVLAILAVVAGWGGWFGKMNPMRSGAEQVVALTSQTPDVTPDVWWVQRAEAARQHAPEGEGAAAHDAAAGHGAPVDPGDAEHEVAGHGDPVAHTAHARAMILSLLLAAAGIALGAAMYWQRRGGRTLLDPAALATRLRPVHRLLWNKYYIDELYTAAIVMPTRAVAVVSALFDRRVIDSLVNVWGVITRAGGAFVAAFDRIVVDGLLVMGSAKTTWFAGDRLSYAQTGRVRQYLVFAIAGLVIIGGLMIWVF